MAESAKRKMRRQRRARGQYDDRLPKDEYFKKRLKEEEAKEALGKKSKADYYRKRLEEFLPNSVKYILGAGDDDLGFALLPVNPV